MIRTTTVDGKPAIEISSVHPRSGPRTNDYVNPTTYAPIELDSYGYESPKDVTRVRFSVYQTLPLAGHQRLLRFAAPPNARIDRTPPTTAAAGPSDPRSGTAGRSVGRSDPVPSASYGRVEATARE